MSNNDLGIFIIVVGFSFINIYFIADYLREITKAIRELTIVIKDHSLKQSIDLENIRAVLKKEENATTKSLSQRK